MLTTLTVRMEENKTTVSTNWGSLLHGFLMQQVQPDYADYLHKNNLKPFSQFIHIDKENKNCIWKISTISGER